MWKLLLKSFGLVGCEDPKCKSIEANENPPGNLDLLEETQTNTKVLVSTFHGQGADSSSLVDFTAATFKQDGVEEEWIIKHLDASDFFDDSLWIPQALNAKLASQKSDLSNQNEDEWLEALIDLMNNGGLLD